MALITNYIRRISKFTKTKNVTATAPSSNDHTDGTWNITDIYEGEFFLNLEDWLLYVRNNTDIIKLNFDVLPPTWRSTIAELRAIKKLHNTSNVGCYENESIYEFDASSTAADDGDLIIKPTNISVANPGRLIKRFSFSVNNLNKGGYTDESHLLSVYPNGIADPEYRRGWTAILESTDTVWVWSVDSNSWIDSGGSITGDKSQEIWVGNETELNSAIILLNNSTLGGDIHFKNDISLSSPYTWNLENITIYGEKHLLETNGHLMTVTNQYFHFVDIYFVTDTTSSYTIDDNTIQLLRINFTGTGTTFPSKYLFERCNFVYFVGQSGTNYPLISIAGNPNLSARLEFNGCFGNSVPGIEAEIDHILVRSEGVLLNFLVFVQDQVGFITRGFQKFLMAGSLGSASTEFTTDGTGIYQSGSGGLTPSLLNFTHDAEALSVNDPLNFPGITTILGALQSLSGGGGGISFFEVTVGATGADYATLGAAQAAGARKVIFVDDTTETADIDASDMYIELDNHDLDMADNVFTGNPRYITGSRNGSITFADGSTRLFTSNQSVIAGRLIINNNSVSSQAVYESNDSNDIFEAEYILLRLPNFIRCGFGTGSRTVHFNVERLDIVGGGVTCYYALHLGQGYIHELNISGTFNNTQPSIHKFLGTAIIKIGRINNTSSTVTFWFRAGLVAIGKSYIGNCARFFTELSGKVHLDGIEINCDVEIDSNNNLIENSEIAGLLDITGDENMANNNKIEGDISVSGDDNTISGNIQGAKANNTLTATDTGTDNNWQFNRTETAIDTSGATTPQLTGNRDW